MKKIVFIIAMLASFAAGAQQRITVAQDGSGNYRTVQEAINAVPDFSEKVTKIFVKPGTYKERIVLARSKINVFIIGGDAATTILTWDDYASKTDSSGRALGTSRTASFYAYGAGFTATNITFENSSGPIGQALAIYVGADRARFFNCRFLGFQDTILTNNAGDREYYYNCYIEGTTDFIFGPATALFEKCKIFCKKGGMYITAASTPDTVKYGYVFLGCDISGSAPENSFHLGRPWRPFAKVVFIRCNLASVVKDLGWHNWLKPGNEKTAYYAEYKNTGPGFQPDKRVAWSHQLTDDEAKAYTKTQILKGWDPALKDK
ncbi:pectinesterase family protein [Hufsiella ginkgonis]|uniref:Pectinesterase n=1 Tax=Hufsiella ginkgonis TaxID=2695274 RepID=A0A7K1XT30_9SPHI|nr:pectinesterase family protein [Hufsiella ginkgonis]MXV14080.1 pectin esterase [Hufsiella ginkgonis]